MLRRFIFKNTVTEQEITLPVTPASYQLSHSINVRIENMHTVGDIPIGGNRKAETFKLDCLFPASPYPFLQGGAALDPLYYVDFFKTAADKLQPLLFFISDAFVREEVLVETISYGERDGSNDIYASLTLIAKPAASGSNYERSVSGPQRPATEYKVVEGDTLGSICRKYYGDAWLYPKVATYNSIPNPHLIHPDQIIRLPPKDVL